MASEDSSIDETDIDFLGAECFFFFSSRSLKTRKVILVLLSLYIF